MKIRIAGREACQGGMIICARSRDIARRMLDPGGKGSQLECDGSGLIARYERLTWHAQIQRREYHGLLESWRHPVLERGRN